MHVEKAISRFFQRRVKKSALMFVLLYGKRQSARVLFYKTAPFSSPKSRTAPKPLTRTERKKELFVKKWDLV